MTIDELVGVLTRESGVVVCQLRQLGGALARIPADSGARGSLTGEIALFAVGLVLDPASGTALQRTLREIDRICAPARVGAYPSFVEQPADTSTFFDAATWTRLREVKALYDPSDRFRGNHHVPPAR